MSQRTKPPFRADHVGSLRRPDKLIEAHKAFLQHRFDPKELSTLEDQAIAEAVTMQERVGLQGITDGEMRRNGWRDNFFENVDGFSSERIEASFWFTEFSGERRPAQAVPVVTGKLRRREPITADDFARLMPLVKRTAKATIPSPTVTHFFGGDGILKGSPYADRYAFFEDVAAIYRQEIADLAKAGCTYLQVDEVTLAMICDPRNQEIIRERGEDPDRMIDDYINLINSAIREHPSTMTVCMHSCRGNMGHGAAGGGYAPVAERMFNQVKVAGFFLEYDTERAGGFEPLAFVPKDKLVVLGLMSTKLPELESVDALRRRVDEAARYVDLERLCISPQCGFASAFVVNRFTPEMQERKLARLIETAGLIWG